MVDDFRGVHHVVIYDMVFVFCLHERIQPANAPILTNCLPSKRSRLALEVPP